MEGLLARGLEQLVARVLLLLPPAALRAARQVCTRWNCLVLALWGSKPGKRRLEAKLRESWRSSDNTAMQLGVARSQVSVIACLVFKRKLLGMFFMISLGNNCSS